MTVQAVIYVALAIAVVCVCVAKWSVVRMVREINRLELPGGERLMPSVSLWWWPNYKDRRIWAMYRALQPYSALRWVYPGSLMASCLLVVAAVLVAAHTPGGVQ